MEIKPVKNYKKPLYAAAAAVAAGVMSGCSAQLGGAVETTPDVSGSSDGISGTSDLAVDITTYDLTAAAPPVFEGTVPMTTEKTTEETTEETTPSPLPETTVAPVTTSVFEGTVPMTSDSTTTSALLPPETTTMRSTLEGTVPVYTQTEDTIMLDGEVSVGSDTVIYSDTALANEALLYDAFYAKDVELRITSDTAYIGDTEVQISFASGDPDIVISFSCECRRAVMELLESRAKEGKAERTRFGYIDKAEYDSGECVFVFVECRAGEKLAETQISDVIMVLKKKGII